MKSTAAVAASNDAPFSRPLEVRSLPLRTVAVDLDATVEERAAIAADLGVAALDKLRLTGALNPWRKRGWRFEGRLVAEAAQICGVTLEPVPESIDEPLTRFWSPDIVDQHGETVDVDSLNPDEDDAPEPLGEMIDLGPAAVETLVLALDPYPRAPDAALDAAEAAPPGVAPLAEAETKPFAGLAALRQAMTDRGSGSSEDEGD